MGASGRATWQFSGGARCPWGCCRGGRSSGGPGAVWAQRSPLGLLR
eukprot:jgi/Mesen1/9206/ME000591S08532